MTRRLMNRLNVLLGALLIFLGQADSSLAQTCAVQPQGMIGWWRAETNGTDFLGLNSVSLVGNVGFTNGEVGSAFKFDGSGSCVSINTSTNFALQDFTIEAWIQRSSTSVASKNGNG